MTTAVDLPNGHRIGYESAEKKDFDVIQRVEQAAATEKLRTVLQQHEKDIVALAKHHLCLGPRDTCHVQQQWIIGGFNICIPIQVTGRLNERLLLRCPLPHKHAEPYYPGTVDENLRGEIGAYAWIHENCPGIRTPRLYGFGFSNNADFTHESCLGVHVRLWQRFRRALYRILQYPTLTRFVPNPLRHDLPTGYMMTEYVGLDVGQRLFDTWDQGRQDPTRLETLSRSLARIMLALSRLPQPEIGSFRFNDDGTIALTNRPLTCATMILESEGTPRTTNMGETYECTDAFVADMISLHDNRLRSNPSATDDEADCRSLMATRAMMRTMAPHFMRKERRRGPFPVQLTDLHPGNIVVDESWNVTCIFDLGEMCALPSEMASVPYWLAGCAISDLTKNNLVEFDRVRRRFMQILEEEEEDMARGRSLSGIMQEMWESEGVWFWHSLSSVDAAIYLVEDHLCPKFQTRLIDAEEPFAQFWCEGADKFVRGKLVDYRRYNERLRQLFNE